MQINLQKGQSINLSKETGGSSLFEVRASWDTSLAGNCDIDIMVAECDQARKALDFIFFNKMKSVDGAIRLSGDNRTGEGDGPDEIISIDFSKVSSNVKSIPAIVNIYNGAANFGLVKNLSIEIYDVTNNTSVALFTPELEASLSTAMVLGEFIENNGNFFFKAQGVGYNKLEEIVREYGISF